jgi:hypothetical protein
MSDTPKKRGRPRKNPEMIDEFEDEVDEQSEEELRFTLTKPRYVTDLPKRIKFTRPHGYIDDDGHMHYWFVGQIEDDAENIATVIDRGCTDFEVA